MWPKAFAQLVELAPHISRLLPMADRFFQSKTTGDDDARKAVEVMAQGLRGDLGQITTTHAELRQQIVQLSKGLDTRFDLINAQVSSLGTDVRGARAAAEAVELRLARVEADARLQRLLLVIALVLLVAVLTLLLLPLLRGR